MNIRALVLSGVCLAAMALIMPVASAQQGVGDLAGAWKIEPASTHEGLPVELLLKVSDSEVTIARNGGRPEVYKFDRTETQPPDGRNGKAEFAGGTLTLTFTRRTLQGNTGLFVTTTRQVYRLSQNNLTLEWQAFAQGPDDPAGKWSEVQRGAYRRLPK